VVLLVDGWDRFGDLSGGPRQDLFTDLLVTGAAAGLTVCLAGDESITRPRLLGRLPYRLVLRLNNPTDGTNLGLSSRNLPAGLPPGRALWTADGSQVQLPLLAADPSGPAQAAALSAIAARLRTTGSVERTTGSVERTTGSVERTTGSVERTTGSVDPQRRPLRLDPLPTDISLSRARELGPPPPGVPAALLGVTGDTLAPIWLDLNKYRRVLVGGPKRSGRSTAIASIAASVAASLAAGGTRVLLVAPEPTRQHEAAQRIGAVLLDKLPTEPTDHDVVLVDDADELSPEDPVLSAYVADPDRVVVLAATLDGYGRATRGAVWAARRAASAMVLLSPPDRISASNMGVSITLSMAFTGPPGRAYFVVDGAVQLGQVASALP
jgi:S-DNA-T family DNA segregation ATPase FtsK/SpoIIIE